MRIRITEEIFQSQTVGGISRYFRELAEALHNLGHSVSVGGLFHSNNHLRDIDQSFITTPMFVPRTWGTTRLGNWLSRVPQLAPNAAEINHVSYYQNHRVKPKRGKFAVTFFDMIQEKVLNDFSLLDAKRKCCQTASVVFAISEATKNDMLDLLDIDESTIYVTYLAASEFFSTKTPGLSALERRKDILWVGGRSHYKNFNNFLTAFSLSKCCREDFQIVCAGSPLTTEEKELAANLRVEGQIRSIQCDDSELREMYKNSALLAYLSSYEGFGIPPLEAMNLGCPVLTSNTSSIPEVVGTAAHSVNPLSIDEIIGGLDEVCLSSTYRDSLAKAGYDRSKMFTWRRCAEQTIEGYQYAMQN